MPTTTVLDRLEAAWRRSDEIFSMLAPGSFHERPISLRHPFIFYVGHLPVFGWNQVCRRLLEKEPFRREFDDLFERGIDPLSESDPAARSRTNWPELAEIESYRDRVRAALREAFAEVASTRSRDPLLENARIFEVVLEHELMHHETLLYMVQQLDRRKRFRPEGWPEPAGSGAGRRRAEKIRIREGAATLGADFGEIPFGWDNEFPKRAERVPAFAIDSLPVTNAEFLEFVEAGGYGDPRCFSAEGLSTLRRHGVREPRFWTRESGALSVRTLFDDVPFETAASWPVTVSWIEADAFARWRGERLPTEAELLRASHGTPGGGERRHPWGDEEPSERHGNFDFRGVSPGPVGTHPEGRSAFGVEDTVGDGWEWTATAFQPHPGFRPWIRTYPGYSADFFDAEHYVLLGASFATSKELVRRSFRNWFQPNYPFVFSKFRCARST